MAPYLPGKPIEEVQRQLGLEDVVKLASNENAFGPSPLALEAMRSAATTGNFYPDATAYELRKALAERLGLPEEQITLGAGSDELIHLLSLAMLEREDNVIAADPSFPRYVAGATLAQAEVRLVPLDDDERLDLSAIAAAIDDKTKIVWLANPNNPTGTAFDKRAFQDFRKRIPESALIVLDEAYYEFASGPDYPDAAEYLKSGIPIVGLRTFSKAYGLAGLRVGYGFGPKEIIAAIERIRSPFNINSLAQAAALAALGDEEHLRNTLELSRRGVAELTKAFTDWGAKVAESKANFVWADLGRPAAAACGELLQKGLIVRSGAGFGRPNCIRVSTGTPQQNERFTAALKETLKELAPL